MYKFIKIRHGFIKQCHGNYKEMKTINYKLENGIFRNSTLKILGVLRGSFIWFGCPKRHPDALLAKTMEGSPREKKQVCALILDEIFIPVTLEKTIPVC